MGALVKIELSDSSNGVRYVFIRPSAVVSLEQPDVWGDGPCDYCLVWMLGGVLYSVKGTCEEITKKLGLK